MYFFDRSSTGFESILDMYRRGGLHYSSANDANHCTVARREELIYWGIDEYAFQSCCGLKYHQVMERSMLLNWMHALFMRDCSINVDLIW